MIPIATGAATSVAANTTSSVTINKSYEFLGKGRLVFVCKPSATGGQYNLFVGGVQLAKSAVLFKFGAAGGMDMQADLILDQRINGGRVELELINTTGAAITFDYYLGFEPQ